MVVAAFGVSTLCFLAVEFAPGDRAVDVAMARYGIDGAVPEAVEYVRMSEGLHRSAAVRYGAWMASLLSGRWGHSSVGGEAVFPLLMRAFRRTALLAGAALGISLLLAFPLGIYCGCRPGSLPDLCSSVLAGVLSSFPSFVTGVFLVLLLAVRMRLFPAAGFVSAAHVVLPALTLGLGLAASSCRVTASAVLQARQSGHYAFARHKGLRGGALFLPHGLLNAAPAIAVYTGLQAAGLLDGVAVIETLFAWPGLGGLLLDAVRSGDILVVQGAGLLLGWIYVTVNSVTELAAGSLSPFPEGSRP